MRILHSNSGQLNYARPLFSPEYRSFRSFRWVWLFISSGRHAIYSGVRHFGDKQMCLCTYIQDIRCITNTPFVPHFKLTKMYLYSGIESWTKFGTIQSYHGIDVQFSSKFNSFKKLITKTPKEILRIVCDHLSFCSRVNVWSFYESKIEKSR